MMFARRSFLAAGALVALSAGALTAADAGQPAPAALAATAGVDLCLDHPPLGTGLFRQLLSNSDSLVRCISYNALLDTYPEGF